jgi:hypothetical protein
MKFKNLFKGVKIICDKCRDVKLIRRFADKGFLAGHCECGGDYLFYYGQAVPKSRAIFNSFFDIGTGTKIESLKQMRDLERSGKIFCKHDEFSRETARNKKYLDEKARLKMRKNIESKVDKLYQGFSFQKSLMEKGKFRLN